MEWLPLPYNKHFADAKNRSDLLQYWANSRGDFKVAYSFNLSNGDKGFSKHKTVIQCQEEEDFLHLEKASHRQIFKEEIVLDFDKDKFQDEKQLRVRFLECISVLDELKVGYRAFITGSTGFHIHISLDRIQYEEQYKKFERLKLHIIARFNCDMLKSSSNVLIALEFAPHWKTGKQKEMLFDTTGEELYYDLSR